jgi:hypothetical protein
MLSDLGDRYFVSGNVSSLPELRWKTGDRSRVDVGDLASIRSRTEKSLVGRDDENVLDETARKSFESIEIEFASSWSEQLDTILSDICAKMHLNMRLEAHVGKLLLYESGDFFLPHRDAEHRPGHFLSMVVDLHSDAVGGSVRFGAPSALSDRSWQSPSVAPAPADEWHSRTGAWAAWFASSWHSVKTISSGHRIVLTFDIVAHPPTSINAPLFPLPVIVPGGAPPFAALVWDNIASMLSVADCSRLARTCRALRSIVGGDSARLLARNFRLISPKLTVALRNRNLHSIGIICRHSYLFDAAHPDALVPPAFLKGRDRAFAEAMRLCGWPVSVCKAILLDEFMSDETIVKRCRVGCKVLDAEVEDEIFNDDPESESMRLLTKLLPKVAPSEFYEIVSTDTEFDGSFGEGTMVVPFPGVLWFETIQSAQKAWNTSTGVERDNLWGNASMFGLRTFEACALVVQVIDPDELHVVSLAQDIRLRNHRMPISTFNEF